MGIQIISGFSRLYTLSCDFDSNKTDHLGKSSELHCDQREREDENRVARHLGALSEAGDQKSGGKRSFRHHTPPGWSRKGEEADAQGQL